MDNNTPILEIQNLTITLSELCPPILDNISLKIYPGDFVILLGSNGSGKSSLIKAINGSIKYDGNIILNGQTINNQKIETLAKEIATLNQDLNLSTFSEMTVLENCLLAAISKKQKIPLNLPEYLEQFNYKLPQKLHQLVKRLSGGEKQALALAMAAMSTPKLLLLDEHTSALDPKTAQHIAELTYKMAVRNNLTTIMTTHNLNHAVNYGNHIIALKNGKVILQTTKNNVNNKDLLELCY